MRRTTFVSAGLLALAALAATGLDAQQTAGKVAFIDSQRILESNAEVRQAQQTLNAELQQYQQELDQMGRDVEQLIQQYQNQQLTLSPEAKQAREQQIRTKQEELSRRAQELDQQAAARSAEIVQPIMARINAVIETIRTEGQYAMIFDAATQAIIAADPALDLTDQVISRLGQAQAANPGNGTGGGGLR